MLDPNRMATNFKTKMIAQFGAVDEVSFMKFATALMESVVEEFKDHGVVSIDYKDGQYPGGIIYNTDVDRTATNGTIE